MIFLLGLVVVHITILAKMVFLPYPELFLYPYLANQGLIPYKQILDQHFPGLMFLPINLNNLGFQTPSDARYWQLGIVMLVQILIYVVAKRIFKSEKKALFANLIFLPWQIFFEGWVLWIDSFLPIFYLTALYFFVICFEEKKEKFAIYAGIMLGIATVFKQVTIPLVIALFVYFSFIKSKKNT